MRNSSMCPLSINDISGFDFAIFLCDFSSKKERIWSTRTLSSTLMPKTTRRLYYHLQQAVKTPNENNKNRFIQEHLYNY